MEAAPPPRGSLGTATAGQAASQTSMNEQEAQICNSSAAQESIDNLDITNHDGVDGDAKTTSAHAQPTDVQRTSVPRQGNKGNEGDMEEVQSGQASAPPPCLSSRPRQSPRRSPGSSLSAGALAAPPPRDF